MDRYSKPPTVAQRAAARGDRGGRLHRRDDPHRPPAVAASIALGGFVLLFYVPLGYYTDLFFYRRRQAKQLEQRAGASRGRADVHRRAVPGELLPRAPRGLRPRAARRSRRRGRAPAGGDRASWASSPRRSCSPTPTSTTSAPSPRSRAPPARRSTARATSSTVLARPDALLPAGFGPVEALGGRAAARRRRAPAARGLRHRRRLHARPQPRPRDLRRSTARCSPATCSSRARSGAPTCPAATTRRSWPRSRRCSSASTTTRRSTPATWGSRRSAASARRTPSCRRSRAGEREAPGAARHVRRAARAGRRARGPRGRRARDPRAAPATGASRRRPSRPPSSSPAAWASRPTSSRRRCTPSRTPAGAR